MSSKQYMRHPDGSLWAGILKELTLDEKKPKGLWKLTFDFGVNFQGRKSIGSNQGPEDKPTVEASSL